MKVKKVDISLLKEAENNVRLHNERQLVELQKSVRTFGQVRPIVVDDDYNIIAGNGLYKAMLTMGETEADILIMENISEVNKRKLMLADNKIFELGSTDSDNIIKIIEEIKFDFDGDLEIPGFDEGILELLIGRSDEIQEQISDYGTVSESLASDHSDKKIAPSNEDNQTREMVLNNQVVQVKPATANDVAKPFVTCPKCGEVIWL